jgi:alpha-tubulin suppressor-like RCC1 family protein
MTSIARWRGPVASSAALSLLTVCLAGSPASAATGDALTFGASTYGQLGNGTVGTNPQPSPELVRTGVTDVAGGREHTLALVAGRVWAWGADLKGAVGDGNGFSTSVNVPKQVSSTVSGADSVTTGHYHSMALDTDTDSVWAWGWNSRGQIGPSGGHGAQGGCTGAGGAARRAGQHDRRRTGA